MQKEAHIIIVGAGLGGICAAVELKKQFGFENFTVCWQWYIPIYERDSHLGGCGCDVPAHWYSLSSELNPNWSEVYASQPEIRAYWENIFFKYGLAARTQFSSMVTSATWSNETQKYTVEVTDMISGSKNQVEANIMFYAIGGFQKPVFSADVPGADSFNGPIWHTARYNHTVELKGKRVGVIGNGCSGAQLVPAISVDPSVQVTNFCRTPQWIVPRPNYVYPRWIKWMFAHLPFVMKLYRLFITLRFMSDYIASKAPKDEVERLIPSYPPGCKRIIVDPGYLDSLNRPNVNLSWAGIERIVDNGIKLKTGEVVPLDVIIFATGFSVIPEDLHVRGSKGVTVKEYFEAQGGPTAYLGCSAPGFPNLFLLLGPNVVSGSTSVIFVQEAQSVEVKDEVCEEYNSWLQNKLKGSVWTSCNSYYHRDGDKDTKIIATFPGSSLWLYWLMRKATRWGIGK
ncbi:hypothetical protein BDP27DRAFT_1380799 [Rhodocollybia butyracea]|uniref:Flavin-containing monooxygenase n=1 Tax=Rhodocollybia butyracea TaxID=206335 RepID=A0A9P5Q6U1_9AGAR|nr:hypothetical protein BDP27DRAFT_1380799 [Rhodocollybia butyracea]